MSSDAKVVGYCRECGKALDETTVRSAQGTIFCEEHSPVKQSAAESSPYTAAAPPSAADASVSPGLAFILGLIPGVGAIYNGQYAKGLVHVIIIGLIISILSSGSASGFEPLLGLLLAGFWFYMAFEAYHTAKRRQQGQMVDEFSSLVPMRGAKFPAGPIILILIGAVFLLSNLGLLEMWRLDRYWPVILIALGAYMLYARASRHGGPR